MHCPEAFPGKGCGGASQTVEEAVAGHCLRRPTHAVARCLIQACRKRAFIHTLFLMRWMECSQGA